VQAVTINKAQGLTLDRATLDLNGVFGCGQVYTGISRVRSIECLSITGFGISKVKAHPRAIEFYGKASTLDPDLSIVNPPSAANSVAAAGACAGGAVSGHSGVGASRDVKSDSASAITRHLRSREVLKPVHVNGNGTVFNANGLHLCHRNR
jgi:hypothetical protein